MKWNKSCTLCCVYIRLIGAEIAFNGENEKMKKSDLTVSTFIQYMEDFRFWVNAAGRSHRLPEKEIEKCLPRGQNLTYFAKKSTQEAVRRYKNPWTSGTE